MTMTYTTLIAQIQRYANRDDEQFNRVIPDFINMAQDRINREAKDIGFQNTVYGTFIVGNPILDKPYNWNKTISLQYGTDLSAVDSWNPLWLRTYEFCRAYWPDATVINQSNPPQFYSDSSQPVNFDINNPEGPYDSFFISPTPDKAYAYELVYLMRPDYITLQNQENWLTQRAPDVLFYACMVEATPFLKVDERTPVWESMYNRALQSTNLQTKERYTDRASVRDKD
jgi:hypothetical protein